MDVLYLWYWLQVRPGVLDFVRGRLFEEDEFDSLANQINMSKFGNATPTRTRRSEHYLASEAMNTGSSSKRCRSTAEPTTRTAATPPAKRLKTEPDRMGDLVDLVGRIVSTREAELQQAQQADMESAARTRAEYHKMLDDILRRITAIESEMSSAASPIKLRLQGDHAFFMEERQQIMDAIRTGKF
ncbi:hypothetical protein PHYBOEH_005857 [Phytophthora boehmeriae]|uniref:Uncharacterized protein n=1 Tax=Phytophthora boehmeriae TaxID=109152 RepID=A0A8T1WP00_9STRA|nr:hypothetical protein PHYBOEH_005857 [Phytophthora boehmeriae]